MLSSIHSAVLEIRRGGNAEVSLTPEMPWGGGAEDVPNRRCHRAAARRRFFCSCYLLQIFFFKNLRHVKFLQVSASPRQKESTFDQGGEMKEFFASNPNQQGFL
jgi:hypothetical protein